jgi:hypothetical protein
MSHRIACLMLAGLAIAAGSQPAISAAPVRHLSGDVDILVNGVPQRRYAHDGRWYVEALKGHEYAIRLRNPFAVRVAVALSVDGLNTIDARETTAGGARKWVLDPYETVTISGWQTSQRDARRFEFTTEERSYGRALGRTANLGVISAVYFKERVARIRPEPSRESARQAPPTPAAPSPAAADRQESAAGANAAKSADEYAATGMGRRTDHAVTQVYLDLEDVAAQRIDIRYEFRPQLVRLGILPAAAPDRDALQRRERARGFEPGFAPVR